MTTQNRSVQDYLEDIDGTLEFLGEDSMAGLRATLEETNKHLADLVFLARSVTETYTGACHVLPSQTRAQDAKVTDNGGEA